MTDPLTLILAIGCLFAVVGLFVTAGVLSWRRKCPLCDRAGRGPSRLNDLRYPPAMTDLGNLPGPVRQALAETTGADRA